MSLIRTGMWVCLAAVWVWVLYGGMTGSLGFGGRRLVEVDLGPPPTEKHSPSTPGAITFMPVPELEVPAESFDAEDGQLVFVLMCREHARTLHNVVMSSAGAYYFFPEAVEEL